MITNNDYKYFNKIRQAAIISDYYKTYIGCMAVYQGNIIGYEVKTMEDSWDIYEGRPISC